RPRRTCAAATSTGSSSGPAGSPTSPAPAWSGSPPRSRPARCPATTSPPSSPPSCAPPPPAAPWNSSRATFPSQRRSRRPGDGSASLRPSPGAPNSQRSPPPTSGRSRDGGSVSGEGRAGQFPAFRQGVAGQGVADGGDADRGHRQARHPETGQDGRESGVAGGLAADAHRLADSPPGLGTALHQAQQGGLGRVQQVGQRRVLPVG